MVAIPSTILAIKNTAPKYLQGVTDQTVRNRFLLAYLEREGRILYNENAPQHVWLVKVREPEVENGGGGSPVVFKTHDTHEQLSISHAQMQATNALDHKTYLINKSPTQIANLTETLLKDLTTTITRKIGDSLYSDNSSDASLITGIRSIMQPHASTAATDLVAIPSATATYGGKLLKLGAFGGRWSNNGAPYFSSVAANDWPEGNGDPNYDALSPKMWQYTGSWTNGTNSWATNGERILRRSRITMESLGGLGMTPTLHLLAPDLYATFLDSLVSRERLQVSDYAKSLGFPNVLQFEGAMLEKDYSCPAGRGYGINPAEMALYSMTDQLFFIDGPEWSIHAQAFVMLVGFIGNVRWNPKHFCEYAQYV